MLFTTLTTSVLLFAASATAAALPPGPPPPPSPLGPPAPPTPREPIYTPAGNLENLSKLFPESDLTSPSDLDLKYVVLGIGTQNYTCANDDAETVPGTTGAYATLYDIGTSLNTDRLAAWKLSSLSALALSLAEWAPGLVDMSLRSQGYEHITGHHFFAPVAGVNTPTFSFDHLASPFPMTQVAKLGAVDAPSSACPGRNGLPAVPWLFLQHQSGQGVAEGGIDTVYRVETAGGNRPASCEGMPERWEVKYAAQYWVYGPKQ
ncbi:malate dehydrogenase [Pyrenophora seminiperda CCB06]|uniref:Malate dehydrogenase n=1 Tax=Pyrenophora seminiperda CCB06 TaxID=1302712 RepID=A0A3M7LZU2_9PLEO|nr:malate dehydrogenase [Pyrenophora seminiperda CCB06]